MLEVLSLEFIEGWERIQEKEEGFTWADPGREEEDPSNLKEGEQTETLDGEETIKFVSNPPSGSETVISFPLSTIKVIFSPIPIVESELKEISQDLSLDEQTQDEEDPKRMEESWMLLKQLEEVQELMDEGNKTKEIPFDW